MTSSPQTTMWMSQLNKLPPPIGNLKQMTWINDNIDQQAWDSIQFTQPKRRYHGTFKSRLLSLYIKCGTSRTSILVHTLGFYISAINFGKKRAVCFAKSGWGLPDTYIHHHPNLVEGIFPNSPGQWSFWLMGNFFTLGSRVCTELINSAEFWHHTNVPSFPLVTYPPPAVTPKASMNLGPVARLDCGEGQMREQACTVWMEEKAHSIFRAGCTMMCRRW